MTEINIKLIRRDGGTQPRAAINHLTVAEYLEDMKEGAEFPPVTLFYDGTDYWLADGFHRVEAAFGAGLTQIAASVKQGTRRDAILYSVGANSSHGLRRTNADKKRVILTLLDDSEWKQWSDREIAKHCKVDHKTVGKIRASLTGEIPSNKTSQNPSSDLFSDAERTYRTKHGTVAQMNTGNIGSKKTKISKSSSLDWSQQPPYIGDEVTVIGEHQRLGDKGSVTQRPAPHCAIVCFENGERETIDVKYLERISPPSQNVYIQEETDLPTPSQPPNNVREGINYKPGQGCEWYVKVSQETWEELIFYQRQIGAASPGSAVKRLLDEVQALRLNDSL